MIIFIYLNIATPERCHAHTNTSHAEVWGFPTVGIAHGRRSEVGEKVPLIHMPLCVLIDD